MSKMRYRGGKRHPLDVNVLKKKDKNQRLLELFKSIQQTEKSNLEIENSRLVEMTIEPANSKDIQSPLKLIEPMKIKFKKRIVNDLAELESHSEEEEEEGYYTKNDEKINHLLNFKDNCKNFLEIVDNIQKAITYCDSQISETDRQMEDIKHEMRGPKKSASQGYKIYQLGHYTERRRQDFKDLKESLLPIARCVSTHRNAYTELKNAMGEIDRILELRKSRVYMPRSNLNLSIGDKFKALPKEEQQKVRENFERSRHRIS